MIHHRCVYVPMKGPDPLLEIFSFGFASKKQPHQANGARSKLLVSRKAHLKRVSSLVSAENCLNPCVPPRMDRLVILPKPQIKKRLQLSRCDLLGQELGAWFLLGRLLGRLKKRSKRFFVSNGSFLFLPGSPFTTEDQGGG